MKIIIHTQYYPPETGAPQVRLSEFARLLVLHGHDVTVLTAFPNYPVGRFYPGYGGLVRKEEKDGVKIIRTWIYPTKSVEMMARLANYFSFVFSSLFFGAFLLPKADYLLTESPPLFLGMSGYVLSRLKKARWIFNVSDLWPESAVRLGVVREGLPLKLSQWLELFCYRKASLVSGQSRDILKGVIAKMRQVSTYHFSNGVDSARFNPGLRSEEVHRELGDGAPCVAIYAGLHGIAQGLDQILEASEMLADLEGKLKIVLIGDGPEKEALLRKAGKSSMVKFLPSKPKDEIPRLLASADIALIPLKLYIPGAVPSKIYEAMASGLSIILLAEGEAATLVNEAGAGNTMSPGSVERLAETLRELTLNSAVRRLLGGNGRKAAIERFDRQAIVGKFLNYLEELK